MKATFHFARVDSRQVVSEEYLCETHAREFLAEFRSSVCIGAGLQDAAAGAICIDFEMIIYHDGPEDTPACVYLHEVGGTRRLCTILDGWAWWALMAQIKQQAAPRPFTHAAWTETISKLGGNLESVVLDKLNEADPWFDAKVRIPKEDKVVTIDVRPSDAYVLAVISGAPIVIAETVLRRYADVGGDGLEG